MAQWTLNGISEFRFTNSENCARKEAETPPKETAPKEAKVAPARPTLPFLNNLVRSSLGLFQSISHVLKTQQQMNSSVMMEKILFIS